MIRHIYNTPDMTARRLLSSVLLALPLLALALLPRVSTVGAQHGPAPLCFPETTYCLEASFKDYWQQNGGLAVFGYPISTMEPEYSVDSGIVPLTQWLERNRFELHSQNPAPYHVLLGRLGDDRLRQLGIDWTTLPRESGPRAGCLWFGETGHNVCDQGAALGFKSYWQSHGLNFGDPGISHRESLALFGLPLTEPRMETNSSGDTVLTQWFERARFEWHPDQPNQYKVLLGRLGAEVLAARRPLTQASGFVRAINYDTRRITLEEPWNGISTVQVKGDATITELPDGRPTTFNAIHAYGPGSDGDGISAFGTQVTGGVLYADYVVITNHRDHHR